MIPLEDLGPSLGHGHDHVYTFDIFHRTDLLDTHRNEQVYGQGPLIALKVLFDSMVDGTH